MEPTDLIIDDHILNMVNGSVDEVIESGAYIGQMPIEALYDCKKFVEWLRVQMYSDKPFMISSTEELAKASECDPRSVHVVLLSIDDYTQGRELH